MMFERNDNWTPERILASDREYVIHSWSRQGDLAPMVVAGGSGSWFWDASGKKYLDFQSQLANMLLGHQHPRMVEAIQKQAAELCYIGPQFAQRSRAELGELLAELTPGDLRMSFFTTGGAAANENAIRLARHYTGRHKIISRYRSYHGATAGSLSLSGDPRRIPSEPGIPGVVRMLDPYPYQRPDDQYVNTAAHLEELLMHENPATVAAVILEPMVATGGMIIPPDDYLPQVREVCDKHGILLIIDEVVTAFGRTGEWFASNHWNVVPDILITAKGLNSGYVPLGAMTVSTAISHWLQENMFWGGLTYAGHPLACASGVESIRIIQEEGLIENAQARGEQLAQGLRVIAEEHEIVGDVRGRGVFWALELVKDRDTREPLAPYGGSSAPIRELLRFADDKQLHLGATSNIIRLTPPLVITPEEVDFALAIIDEALTAAETKL